MFYRYAESNMYVLIVNTSNLLNNMKSSRYIDWSLERGLFEKDA